MIVDDEPAVLRMCAENLKEFVNTALAPSGKEALAYLSANRDIDLVLLDINMPEMDGFTVIRQLKNKPHTADLPVVFFSSSQDQEQIAKGIREGAVDYILKPYANEVLLDKVAFHLGNRIRQVIRDQCDADSAATGKDRIILDSLDKIGVIVDMARCLPPKKR